MVNLKMTTTFDLSPTCLTEAGLLEDLDPREEMRSMYA